MHLMTHHFNVEVDNWAIGVLLYEMLTGNNPFDYDQNDSERIVEDRIMMVITFHI